MKVTGYPRYILEHAFSFNQLFNLKRRLHSMWYRYMAVTVAVDISQAGIASMFLLRSNALLITIQLINMSLSNHAKFYRFTSGLLHSKSFCLQNCVVIIKILCDRRYGLSTSTVLYPYVYRFKYTIGKSYSVMCIASSTLK